ncbi:cadherin-like beta sandwich domain-containing protein [Roseburia hominis]
MKKKIAMIMMALSLTFGVVGVPQTVFAASGSTSVSVSSGSVNIGDTVTVTVKASGPSGEKANATMTLSYDSSVLQFVSCNTTYGGGGGSVMATGESYTVTLKAVSAGNSSLSVSANDGVIFDSNEEMDSMSGSSASVTVKNAASTNTDSGNNSSSNSGTSNGNGTSAGGNGDSAANTGETTGKQSADNSLKELTISPGTLSPAFNGKTLTYSATVGSDVTNIAVSATPVNEKAVVESVTGNTNLKSGDNTIKIVVKAENGVTATYTVNVTKQGTSSGETTASDEGEVETTEETDSSENTVTVNGISYVIAENFATENIPADFSETTVNYQGADYRGVSYDKGSVVMLYLVQDGAEESTGSFFVYDSTRDTLYPFVKMVNGEHYVIALLAPVDYTMPDTMQQTQLTLADGSLVTAYQETQDEGSEVESEFYSFYGVNSDGTEGWYQYDSMEETYQRVNTGTTVSSDGLQDEDTAYLQEEYLALSEKYKKERAFSRTAIGVLIFLLAVMAVVLINLLLHRRGDDEEDLEDDDDIIDDAADESSETAGTGKLPEETPEDAEEPDDFDAYENEDDIEEEEPPKKRFGFWKRKSDDLDDDLFDDDEDAYEDAYGDDNDTYGDDAYEDCDAPEDEKVSGGEEKAAARKPAGDGITAGRKERRTGAADDDAADEPENEPLYEEKRPKKKKSGKDQKNKQDDELDIIDFNDL